MDFHEASKLSIKSLLEQHNKEYSDSIYEIYHELNLKVWEAFEKNEIDAIKLRYLRFELFLHEMGWNFNAKEWGKTYLEGIVKYTELFDQTIAILDYTKQKYKIAAVTNGLQEVQRPRLRKCGIYEKFDHIQVSDEIGYSKPDIAFFQYLFENIGQHEKNEMLIIGDSLSSDMEGGKNAGIDTCWFDVYNQHTKMTNKPAVNYRITELNELRTII